MRFALFFCALLAVFGGVRAETPVELASAEITFSGASEHPDSIKTSESGETQVFVFHEDAPTEAPASASHAAHTNSKTMNELGSSAPTVSSTFPWTRIFVGDSFDAFTFYQLRIQILNSALGVYEDAGNTATDPRGQYYGSYTSPSSTPSNADISSGTLTQINQDVANGAGNGDFVVRSYHQEAGDSQTIIKSSNQGTAGGAWWPRKLGTGKPDNRFTYLWVRIVFPVTNSGPFQGTVKIGLFATGTKNSCTTGACGDPQFIGLQGQNFQFHGMADEVFSLVSSPELQMNSLFKFISSGKCDYNDTMCWTHPGTYLGSIAIQYGADKILLQSGSHEEGMKVFINDKQVTPSKHIHQFTMNNATALAQYRHANKFTFNSDRFFIQLHNSDYFFNLDFGLKDQEILSVGATPMRVTGEICERENRLHKALLADTQTQIKAKLAKTYPTYPLHGLVGQTWRNAEYCGRYFEGNVDDYVVASLFGTDHTFNNFAH